MHKTKRMQSIEQIPMWEVFSSIMYSKTCVNGHSKIDKTKILMTNSSLMKIESIAEWSPWSILQYF